MAADELLRRSGSKIKKGAEIRAFDYAAKRDAQA